MSDIQLFRPLKKSESDATSHKVAVVIYPGFQILSLALTTVLELANQISGKLLYEVQLFSESGGLVHSSLGFPIHTGRLPKQLRGVDTLVVAGNNNLLPATTAMVDFLKQNASGVRRVAATCTGAGFLAQAGLLVGKKATTHWYFAEEFRKRFPDVILDEDRIYVEDGSIWTSAGMTASIDMAIAMVEQDHGFDVARIVAKNMVVYHKRAGGQSQHSVLLDLTPKSDRIQKAVIHAKENLKTIISVEEFAEVAGLSLRQFNRLFRKETGKSPAQALEHLRVEEARLMMESGNHSLDEIAAEVGFGERERMRRAFLRNLGQSPQAIRRFSMTQGR